MARILTHPPECQPALIDKLLPANSIHLLAGAPGAGKTTLAAWLLRELRDGQPVFGYPSHPPAAMAVLVADRGWSSHAQWFAAVGLADIPHYSLHDDAGFRWDRLKHADGWMATLLDALTWKLGALPPGSLLLVDPLTVFLGGDMINYNRIFAALGVLGQLCVARRLTILGTAHASKQRGGPFQYTRPQDRILGSTALVGCADTVFYLATPAETQNDWCELTWTPHHAPAASRRLRRNQDTGLFEFLEDEAPATVVCREGIVLEAVGLAPTPIRAILRAASAHGLSRTTVYRTLNALADEQLILPCQHGHWRRATPQ
jgi:AAA domain